MDAAEIKLLEHEVEKLITCMGDLMGRWPTENEVVGFINGNREERQAIIHSSILEGTKRE